MIYRTLSQKKKKLKGLLFRSYVKNIFYPFIMSCALPHTSPESKLLFPNTEKDHGVETVKKKGGGWKH